MKLNLGCGNDVREGYTNVDFRPTHPSVMQVDLSKFPWPFEDESAEEILMLDFLEHFPYAQTKPILLECFRVLSPTGTVAIQVPDGDHLVRAFGCIGEYTCNRCDRVMSRNGARCGTCDATPEEISEAAMRRMYGGQDYPGNFHQTLFRQSSLEAKARECGLELVGFEEKDYQYINWNFKARFKKGEIW